MYRLFVKAIASILLITLSLSWADDENEITYHPFNVGAFSEFGPVVSGVYHNDPTDIQRFRDEWVDHFGWHIIQSMTVNDRIHFTAGFGGSFQFRKPEQNKMGQGFDQHQRKAPFMGPIAVMGYDVGELENPWLKINFGTLAYKYNPDAITLGEYLFRSRPYPSLLTTGGYGIVNSGTAYLQGLMTNMNFGNFKLDLMFLTETTLPPLYDFSLAAVMSYSILDGFIDLGWGVNFKSIIPVRPSKTTPTARANSYFTHGGVTYSAFTTIYESPSGFYGTRAFELSTEASMLDSGTQLQQITALELQAATAQAKADSINTIKAIVDSLLAMHDTLGTFTLDMKHISASGPIFMGRINVDPKRLFPGVEAFGAKDLRFFVEANLLGWKDHPIFYTDKMERLPIVLGFNVPMFKLLNVLAIQVEFFDNPHLNNSYWVGELNVQTPYHHNSNTGTVVSKNEYMDLTEDDNFKWSVYFERDLFSNLTFRGQMGTTHLQMTSSSLYYGPQFGPQEITTGSKDWYWMLQFAWGI